jgi:hypothetical protein
MGHLIMDTTHRLPPRAAWDPAARTLRDAYARVPGAPIYQREFGWYCREAWVDQGLPLDADLAAEFGFDERAVVDLGGLGWCEAALLPPFTEAVIEDRGEYEVVRDAAGRHVLCFKGRRTGFMPEYLDHPVKDLASFDREIRWRLDPAAPGRFAGTDAVLDAAVAKAARGWMVRQGLIGGYMYLRSLIGPERLLYAVVDDPDLIDACMAAWFELSDAVIARHQTRAVIDELFIAEDICYNKGALISPRMMRRFLLPWYERLIARVRTRQLDPARTLHLHIDSDGDCRPVMDIYRAIGMDAMSPCEVASGCDVVDMGRRWPDVMLSGGIDKRILAAGPAAIDAMVERIVPAMRARGGYIPTCDHGVPAEVRLADYRHYRRRMLELGR